VGSRRWCCLQAPASTTAAWAPRHRLLWLQCRGTPLPCPALLLWLVASPLLIFFACLLAPTRHIHGTAWRGAALLPCPWLQCPGLPPAPGRRHHTGPHEQAGAFGRSRQPPTGVPASTVQPQVRMPVCTGLGRGSTACLAARGVQGCGSTPGMASARWAASGFHRAHVSVSSAAHRWLMMQGAAVVGRQRVRPAG